MAGRVPTRIMLGLIVFLITLVEPGLTKPRYHLSYPWTKFNIGSANEFCNSLNGYLAEINSKEEFEIIRKLIMEENPKEQVFLGGNDISREGVWTWYNSGKNAMNHLKWAKGQPDNWGGNEHCMTVTPSEFFFLNDFNCHQSGRFLCEYRTVV